MVGTWKCGSLKENFFFQHKVGILHSNTLPRNLSEIHFNLSYGKTCILWFGRHWFVRCKVQQSLVGKFLAWIESGWQASSVDKQPLVGSIHILRCQYCDRRDAEWHCHQRCQRPVTFAPLVWEWWRRVMQGGRHTGRRGKKYKQRRWTEMEGRRKKCVHMCALILCLMNHPHITVMPNTGINPRAMDSAYACQCFCLRVSVSLWKSPLSWNSPALLLNIVLEFELNVYISTKKVFILQVTSKCLVLATKSWVKPRQSRQGTSSE